MEEVVLTIEEKKKIDVVSRDIVEIFRAQEVSPDIAMQALRFVMSGMLCSTLPKEAWDEALDAMTDDIRADMKAAVEDPNSPYNKRMRNADPT